MKLSDKRSDELYKAISEPIMKKRITVRQSINVIGEKNAVDIDEMLYRLELDIWSEVQKALGIT